MTTGTAFALASVSKTFTAAVVLQLVEEGRLSLDAAGGAAAAGVQAGPRGSPCGMLLDHTSGLPDFFLNAKDRRGAAGAPERHLDAAQDVVVRARRSAPVPGKVWIYSNTNYLLLGELVRR